MNWFKPSGDCSCGCDCVGPTCELDGVRGGELGDDVTLTWTTSTENNATAELVDSDGTVISTLTGGPNEITVERGACKDYTLTVTNDCGTTFCTWSPPTVEECDCTECPYDPGDGEIDNPQPASICVPCGCERGRATSISLTISGLPASFQDGPADVARLTNTTSCVPYEAGCGPPGTITYYTWERVWTWLDYDILNGTYVFDLLDQHCPTCGAAFRCGVSPSGYYVGTASIELISGSVYPPCDSRYTSPTTEYVELEFCVGLTAPQSTAPYYPDDLECQDYGTAPHVGVYSRVTSQPTGLGLNTGWIRVQAYEIAGSSWSIAATDACDWVATPIKAKTLPPPYPQFSDSCSEFDGAIYYHFPEEFVVIITPGNHLTDIVRYVFGHYDTWEQEVTTEGW